MDQLIVSVSGIRGIVGESLTVDVVIRFAAALAGRLRPGPIVVSRDGRTTGAMLAGAVDAGLRAAGRDVVRAGVAATPTVGVLIRDLGAAGGVQVSASHNPAPYNGLKLFGPDGRVLPAPLGARLADDFRQAAPDWCRWHEVGGTAAQPDPHAAHLAAVLAVVDLQKIAARRFPVLLDANHGAGAVLGRRLLRALGCRATVIGGEPHGRFAHGPEPTAENLRSVGRQVAGRGAAVGFCQDPDADRLALIDAQGRYVGEEYTLALCLDHLLGKRKGPVVVNCATSRMAQDIAARHGVPLHRSAVGEANVADVMLQSGAVFGGEGNGGPIEPRVGLVRDSFVGIAMILEGLAQRGGSLAEWVDALPRYAIHKDKKPLASGRVPAAMDRLEAEFADARASRQDGLRLDWEDRWLLVRASNTEPIVRAIAEAPTAAEAQALCQQALRLL